VCTAGTSDALGGGADDDGGGGGGGGVSVRLLCTDGTQFNEPPPPPSTAATASSRSDDDGTATPLGGDAEAAAPTSDDNGGNHRRCHLYSPELTAHTPPLCFAAAPARLYTKVLVDAECTHDGSIKHVAKFMCARCCRSAAQPSDNWSREQALPCVNMAAS
jgi:hypothetical protein